MILGWTPATRIIELSGTCLESLSRYFTPNVALDRPYPVQDEIESLGSRTRFATVPGQKC